LSTNPEVITCNKGVWNLVATGVTAGVIHKLDNAPGKYLQTFRLTGEAAPTLKSEGALLFGYQEKLEVIRNDSPIDVYVWPINAAGRVRVDV